MPPPRTLAGPNLQPVQLVRDPPQRFAGLPEPMNPLQNCLLAWLRLHVTLVGGLPVAVRRIADELQLRFLVPPVAGGVGVVCRGPLAPLCRRPPASLSCAAWRPASALQWPPAPIG